MSASEKTLTNMGNYITKIHQEYINASQELCSNYFCVLLSFNTGHFYLFSSGLLQNQCIVKSKGIISKCDVQVIFELYGYIISDVYLFSNKPTLT